MKPVLPCAALFVVMLIGWSGYAAANRVIILFPSVGNEADRVESA
jgi:hypothetical protein